MGIIRVNDIRVFANHGCMPEERIIGSDYIVNVVVDADLAISSISDDLIDTVDYVSINSIVKNEMAKPSKLLEHVVKRIIDAIVKTHISIESVEVEVAKINPPINGDVKSVSVSQKYIRA